MVDLLKNFSHNVFYTATWFIDHMNRLLAVSIILAVLLGTVPISGVATPASIEDTPQSLSTAQDFDRVQFRITAHENGSAQWTFHYERTLDSDSERQQFETFADEFNENDSEIYTDFKEQARSLVQNGQNETGREMNATNFEKKAEIQGLDNNVGVVEMSFTWTNFTEPDGDRLVLGDVFAGGLYLAPNQSLVIEASDGLAFSDVEPNPDQFESETIAESESVTWIDEHEFTDSRPRVVFVPASEQNAGGIGGTSGNGDPEFMMLAGLVLVLLGGTVYAWRQGGFDLPSIGNDRPGAGAAEATTASPSGSGGSIHPAVSDEELLTDEARVKKLLEENGGRMKQVNIVEDTGWSKSKVSMLLSEMAEDDEISKLRVGRENIISLDGHEPDAARSPHEKSD